MEPVWDNLDFSVLSLVNRLHPKQFGYSRILKIPNLFSNEDISFQLFSNLRGLPYLFFET